MRSVHQNRLDPRRTDLQSQYRLFQIHMIPSVIFSSVYHTLLSAANPAELFSVLSVLLRP